MILDEAKEAFIKDLVSKGKREDSRAFDEYREIKIDVSPLENAEGSAIAHIGDTKVVCGIKMDQMSPFPDRPTEGVVMFGSEFLTMAHPTFESGPPNENAIELARVVDRGIRAAHTLDGNDFSMPGFVGKVWGVFVDLWVLDHNGNLTDTAALAAMAALRNTRIPKLEDGKIIRKESSGKLKLANDVVTTSVESVAGKLLVDASYGEEVASDGRITWATGDDTHFAAAQKSGAHGFTVAEMDEVMDLALAKRKDLLRHL